MTDEQKQQDEKATEEVEEQWRVSRTREDEEGSNSDDSGDDDGDVEKQARMSDATLKHSIAPIMSATAALR